MDRITLRPAPGVSSSTPSRCTNRRPPPPFAPWALLAYFGFYPPACNSNASPGTLPRESPPLAHEVCRRLSWHHIRRAIPPLACASQGSGVWRSGTAMSGCGRGLVDWVTETHGKMGKEKDGPRFECSLTHVTIYAMLCDKRPGWHIGPVSRPPGMVLVARPKTKNQGMPLGGSDDRQLKRVCWGSKGLVRCVIGAWERLSDRVTANRKEAEKDGC